MNATIRPPTPRLAARADRARNAAGSHSGARARPPADPRSPARPRLALLLAVSAALACAASCGSRQDWYPSGSARIVTIREIPGAEGGPATCVVTLAISNTGRSRIARSTVSLSAETESRRYYRTVVTEVGILPGGAAYLDADLAYDLPGESLEEGSARIESEYYE